MSEHSSNMSTAQKAACLDWAHQMNVIGEFPGGGAFLTDMMLAWCIKAGLTVRDAATWDALVKAGGDVSEALAMGPLEFAAKYGPDFDGEAYLADAIERLRAALKAAKGEA